MGTRIYARGQGLVTNYGASEVLPLCKGGGGGGGGRHSLNHAEGGHNKF